MQMEEDKKKAKLGKHSERRASLMVMAGRAMASVRNLAQSSMKMRPVNPSKHSR
jgi:hypothetical protein